MSKYDKVVELELPEKWFYESLAAGTPVAGLKKILLGLAQDEQKLYDIMKILKTGVVCTMAETTMLEEAKNVLQDLITKRSVSDSLNKIYADGYDFAMQCEANSFRYYEDLAKKAKNSGIAQLLQKMADEERKHFNIMENLYAFAQKPQNFSAWIEFTDFKGH